MADGDYERGRARELDAIAAKLKRLRDGLDTPTPLPDTTTRQRQDNSKDTDA